MSKRIVICPGHHQGARGAVNAQYELDEHTEATKIVTRVEHILVAAGHIVYIVTGSLSSKINQINTLNTSRPVSLAMDLHFNADADHLDPNDYDDTRGNGCMTMVEPGVAEMNYRAAMFNSVLADQLGEKDLGPREGWYWGGNNPGTKPDAFLSQIDCDTLVPEPGYIDNNGFCERHLLDLRWERVASALATAAMAYLEAYA